MGAVCVSEKFMDHKKSLVPHPNHTEPIIDSWFKIGPQKWDTSICDNFFQPAVNYITSGQVFVKEFWQPWQTHLIKTAI